MVNIFSSCTTIVQSLAQGFGSFYDWLIDFNLQDIGDMLGVDLSVLFPWVPDGFFDMPMLGVVLGTGLVVCMIYNVAKWLLLMAK